MNGFARPFEIMELTGGRREQRFSHFGAAKWNLDFKGLSYLTGAFEHDSEFEDLLYPSVSREGVSFFGRNLPLHQLIGHRRIAPGVVKAHGYQKAVWHINSLVFDPQTLELLIERCPMCDCELNFRETFGIPFCQSCKDKSNPRMPLVDLRDFPQPVAEIDDHEAAAFVTGLVDPQVSVRDLGLDRLHPELRESDPGHLFEYIAQVAKALDFSDGNCAQLKRNFSAVGPVTPLNLCRSARAFMNWPDGFVETAANLSEIWFFPKTRDFYDHPLRVRIANKFYGDTLRKSVITRLKQASKLSLVKQKSTEHQEMGGHDSEPVARANMSFAVAKSMLNYAKASRAVRAESAKVGIPVSSLVLCYKEDAFRCPDGLLIKNNAEAPSLLSAVTDMAGHVKTMPKHVLTLRDAVTAIGTADGNPWPLVLKGIANGNLPVVTLGKKGTLLDIIYVREFRPWKEFAAAVTGFDSMEGVFLTGQDVGFLLNCSSTQISNLVKAQLLPQGRIPAHEVWAFRRKYISPRETAARLVMNGERVRANLVGAEMNRSLLKTVRPGVSVRFRSDVEDFYGRRLSIK